MLDSYLPTFFLTVLYLLSIWLGNKYMKNRPALSLKGTLTLYNLGITLLSLYMLAEVSGSEAELEASEAAAPASGQCRPLTAPEPFQRLLLVFLKVSEVLVSNLNFSHPFRP